MDPLLLYYVGSFAFGLVIGSFLNVVIYRLPAGESIVRPASHCPACSTPISPIDNVPLLSYLLLRGRCRHCRVRISPRYPAVELLTGCVFAGVAWRFESLAFAGTGGWPLIVLFMFFAAALLAAAGIDFDCRIIPDGVSLGFLPLGRLAVPAARGVGGEPYSGALAQSVLGALIGGGSLWSVAFLHARISVATGRRFEHWPGEGRRPPRPNEADYWLWFPGLGLGDVKLLAMIGAFLGGVGVLETILAGSVVGLLMGLVHAAVYRSWNSPFGFGPALAIGALAALLAPPGLLLSLG